MTVGHGLHFGNRGGVFRLRIVGGNHAGRHLTSPQDQRVRPTAEATRDGIMKLLGTRLQDARVLDLFAGTGALGLEAISRGAASGDFVEIRPDSLHALKANIAALGLRGNTRVFKKDAIPFAESLPEGAYDIAFADPPYGTKMLDRIVAAWQKKKFARVLVAEHKADQDVLRGSQRKRFDDTAVTIYI